MAQDAMQVNQLLKSGNLDAATMLINDRIDQLKALEADPRDTQRLADMIYNGDIDGAVAATDAVVQAGVAAGLLELPGEGADAPSTSPKTDILADGSVVMTNNRGEVIVKRASGEVVRGQAAIDLVREARRYDAELQGLRSGERAAGSQAIEKSGEYFKQLESVGNSVRLLQSGIEAIENGANTGPIMSRLPSVSDASLALDQVQKEMGLNVLQNTTFGALSASELKFALDTALPTNMGPDQLKEWMKRKLEAQQKLESYLYRATVFLNQPGNTIGKFLQRQEEMGKKKSFTWSELMEMEPGQ
jgi:hypothetical protein